MPQYTATIALSALNGTNGFALPGLNTGDRTGNSVASAGDVNGDGFDDIIIGAPLAEVGVAANAGSSYVIYGSATFGSGIFDLTGLTGTDGFTIVGIDAGDKAGTSVGGGGDFNGDGIEDFLIGAPAANGGEGESYVIFGNASGFAASVNPSTITGTSGALPGVILAGGTGSSGGTSIAFIGDINGDGRDDVIFGGPDATANGQGSAGSSYIVFGSNSFSGASILPGSLDGTNGFRIDGISLFDDTGFSVASAGDVNGDGIADMIIGAPGGNDPGNAYVVFGKSTAYGGVLDLTTLTAADGFAITGLVNGDLFGEAVASAGDVNGDGFDDIIVGAREATAATLTASGESYVIFGKATGFGTSFDVTTLDGTNGFRIQGAATQDRSGKSVASAGDINGDGLDDLVIGANRAGGGGVSGASYVLLGQLSDVAVNLTGTLASQTLVGSNLGDSLFGLGGNDALWGHGGSDTLNGGTGNDTLRGGAGNDTYIIDGLGDVLIEISGFDTVKSTVSKTLAAGFENLTLLGTLNIHATGNTSGNILTGNVGGNVLKGEAGVDTLIGGRGRDIMTGGLSTDVFVRDVFDFNFASETGKTASTRDIIRDFRHLIDDIDLRTIDANGSAAGDTAFTFLATQGAAFTGVKGQLHWLLLNPAGTVADKTIIEGDINGDKIADFQIELTGLKTLTAADFLL